MLGLECDNSDECNNNSSRDSGGVALRTRFGSSGAFEFQTASPS